MPRIILLVVAMFASLSFGGQAFAQLTPPAGTAGAGMAPINGIPYGPGNPRPLADPSGIGNASSVPPLRANNPTITVPQAPLAPSRAAAPTYYPYTSHQDFGVYAVEPKNKNRHRPRGHRQVSSFTGICRGC